MSQSPGEGLFPNGFLVQLYPQARPIRYRDVASLKLEGLHEISLAHGATLLDQEVRRAGIQLWTDRGRYRAQGVVGGHPYIVASAIAAIFLHSKIPPAWHGSGWRTAAACFSRTSLKPHLV